MKIRKVLPFVILLGSLLLSACSGLNVAASVPVSSSSSNTSVPAPIQISAPVTSAAPVIADVQALQNAYEAVYEKVNPSVVLIQISQTVSSSTGRSRGQTNPNSTNPRSVPTALGSGFVWDVSGRIVTNNHVVEGASKIMVTFADGTNAEATLVGADANSDLAVIQVKVDPALLKPVELADSSKAKVGQLVVAIGNPFGLANTMTTGIVSAVARSITANTNSSGANYSIPDVIQTDAAINPGNSGGVLVDMDGRLLGVPSQIESASGSNSGVGFAIPSSIVKQVVPQLIGKGTFARPWLGITGTTLTPDLATQLNLKSTQTGILVIDVSADGPAAKAGFVKAATAEDGSPTAGDVITAVDGKPLTRFDDLVSYLLNQTAPGQTVTFTVLRDGKEQTIKVVLGTQPSA
jgi:2-alkenal reductase